MRQHPQEVEKAISWHSALDNPHATQYAKIQKRNLGGIQYTDFL
jgi:hypothetical protein